jgi:hypothetical protein
MIIDKSKGRLDDIKNFARKNNLEESFDETFSLLEKYSEKGHKVVIYPGYIPLSLEFTIFYEEEMIVGGSVVFHGMFDNKDLSSFSVSLSTGKKVSWTLEI